MKKLTIFVFTLFFVVGLIGCAAQKEHTISIVIPAGSQAEFVYSEEEISLLTNQFTMESIDVSDNTGVALKDVEAEHESISTFLVKGQPVVIYAEKGVWFKIGIAIQNPTDGDIVVSVNVENVKVRIK